MMALHGDCIMSKNSINKIPVEILHFHGDLLEGGRALTFGLYYPKSKGEVFLKLLEGIW